MSYTDALFKEKARIEQKVKIGSELLYLTREECIANGPSLEETLDVVKATFIAHGKKEYEMPAKIGIHPHTDVFFHAMPAYLQGQMACGCKWIECFPRNPKEYGIPQTSSVLALNELITGYPMALMDGTWLTAMRTPAVTAIAAAALHPDAKTFGMFGCGVQGVGHVRFIVKALKKLEKIYIYDVREDSMDSLIEQVKNEVSIPIIKAKNPEEVAKNCDVMSSATIITKETMSIVKAEWVRSGQTIIPCDLNTFWDPIISQKADKYIVDSLEEHQLFDGMGYFPDGLPKVYCETGELIAGFKNGRDTKDQLIVCSNIGMSVFDVAMAKCIFDKALENNAGTILPL